MRSLKLCSSCSRGRQARTPRARRASRRTPRPVARCRPCSPFANSPWSSAHRHTRAIAAGGPARSSPSAPAPAAVRRPIAAATPTARGASHSPRRVRSRSAARPSGESHRRSAAAGPQRGQTIPPADGLNAAPARQLPSPQVAHASSRGLYPSSRSQTSSKAVTTARRLAGPSPDPAGSPARRRRARGAGRSPACRRRGVRRCSNRRRAR